MNNKMAYSIKEVAALTSIGRTKLYELRKQGALTFTKCGHQTLMLHEDLMKFLASLPKAA